MSTLGCTYYQDGPHWIGYLDLFPDYVTQGESFDELKENLADLYADLSSGVIPNVRRDAELEIV